METANFRAYKVVLADGSVMFESKTSDSQAASGCNSIQNLALDIRCYVIDFLGTSGWSRSVSIDLKPFHDIECPAGLSPRRCLPLNEEEANEFWRLFIS